MPSIYIRLDQAVFSYETKPTEYVYHSQYEMRASEFSAIVIGKARFHLDKRSSLRFVTSAVSRQIYVSSRYR